MTPGMHPGMAVAPPRPGIAGPSPMKPPTPQNIAGPGGTTRKRKSRFAVNGPQGGPPKPLLAADQRKKMAFGFMNSGQKQIKTPKKPLTFTAPDVSKSDDELDMTNVALKPTDTAAGAAALPMAPPPAAPPVAK